MISIIIFKIISIFSFLILLVFYNMNLFKLVLYIKNNKMYNNSSLILPSIFNSIQAFVILMFTNHLITNVLEINVQCKNIYSIFEEYIFPVSLILIGIVLLFITFQTISYMLINKFNICYNKKYDPYSYYETSLIPYFHFKNTSLYESLLLSIISFFITVLPFSIILVLGSKIFSIFI